MSEFRWEGGRHKKTFRDDGYVYHLDCGDGFVSVYIKQKISKSYTLNRCTLLFVHYTSIILMRKRERKKKGSVHQFQIDSQGGYSIQGINGWLPDGMCRQIGS